MKIVQFCRVLSIAAVMAMVMTMAGCATRSTGQPSDIDPLESSNRAIYNFNDTIDRAILTPVAEAYRFITPQPVRTCINNIFLNRNRRRYSLITPLFDGKRYRVDYKWFSIWKTRR